MKNWIGLLIIDILSAFMLVIILFVAHHLREAVSIWGRSDIDKYSIGARIRVESKWSDTALAVHRPDRAELY